MEFSSIPSQWNTREKGINIQLLLFTNAEIYGLMIPTRLVRVIHRKIIFLREKEKEKKGERATTYNLETALERTRFNGI